MVNSTQKKAIIDSSESVVARSKSKRGEGAFHSSGEEAGASAFSCETQVADNTRARRAVVRALVQIGICKNHIHHCGLLGTSTKQQSKDEGSAAFVCVAFNVVLCFLLLGLSCSLSSSIKCRVYRHRMAMYRSS